MFVPTSVGTRSIRSWTPPGSRDFHSCIPPRVAAAAQHSVQQQPRCWSIDAERADRRLPKLRRIRRAATGRRHGRLVLAILISSSARGTLPAGVIQYSSGGHLLSGGSADRLPGFSVRNAEARMLYASRIVRIISAAAVLAGLSTPAVFAQGVDPVRFAAVNLSYCRAIQQGRESRAGPHRRGEQAERSRDCRQGR